MGSSLVWASGRDWARFGQLYLDQGLWNGKQLLPATWVRQARTASRGSKKAYGAHWWLSRRKSRPDLPYDSFSAEGYQGQLLLVAPSQRAVIVRLGQTPKKPGFDPMLSGLMFSQPFDKANGRAQFLSPPLGTNAWDAATRSPVISRAGRMTVGPPGAVWEANNSMVWQ